MIRRYRHKITGSLVELGESAVVSMGPEWEELDPAVEDTPAPAAEPAQEPEPDTEPEPETEVEVSQKKPNKNWTVPQLTALAESQGLDVSGMKKADILAALGA